MRDLEAIAGALRRLLPQDTAVAFDFTVQEGQQVRRGPDLLCEGDIRIGCVEAASLRPCRIPPDITALFS